LGAVLLVIKQVTPVSAIEETLITCDAPLPPTLRCTARGSRGFLGAGAATGAATAEGAGGGLPRRCRQRRRESASQLAGAGVGRAPRQSLSYYSRLQRPCSLARALQKPPAACRTRGGCCWRWLKGWEGAAAARVCPFSRPCPSSPLLPCGALHWEGPLQRPPAGASLHPRRPPRRKRGERQAPPPKRPGPTTNVHPRAPPTPFPWPLREGRPGPQRLAGRTTTVRPWEGASKRAP
jgi:hypothetical protein